MAIYWYDTFDGAAHTDLLDRTGQSGASYARSSGPSNEWGWKNKNDFFRLTGDGRAYSGVFGYEHVLYLASGVPGDAEYDVRAIFDSMSDPGGDNYSGVVFKAHATNLDFWFMGYQGYYKRWSLVKFTGGNRSVEGSWDDIQSAPWPVRRNVEVRVRSTSPYIRVWIDGVERITSPDDTTPGNRLGLYQDGGNPPWIDSGLHYAEVAAGSVAFTMPVYTVSGPSVGPPGFASGLFTVALIPGQNPGSITITPSAGGGLSGTFAPTSVTLTDGDRSKTFAFTPSAPGSGTISFTNDDGAPDQSPVAYTSAFTPPERLSFYHSTLTKFTSVGSSPYVAGGFTYRRGILGYWLDGFDHYDPILCYYQIWDYAIRKGLASIPPLYPEIQAGIARFRDRATNAVGYPGWSNNNRGDDWDGRDMPGVQGYHRYLGGIARHFMETGDPQSVFSADVLAPTNENSAAWTDVFYDNVHIGVQREEAFGLLCHIDREMMGLGRNTNALIYKSRVLLRMIDYWCEPYATKKYGVWLKPFMGGLVGRALVQFWERYRDSEDSTLASIAALIPPALKKFSTYLHQVGGGDGGGVEPQLWYPAGVDGGDGWVNGTVTYRDLPNDDPKYARIGPGLAITSVINARTTIRGPLSLSTVDDYYKGSTISIDGTGDGHTIVGYTGATREIRVGLYPFQFDVTTSNTFLLSPPNWASDEGNGPVGGELNGLVASIHGFCYWHHKHIVGDSEGSGVYRIRFHECFNGNRQSWEQGTGQKQWNQSAYWLTEGLDYAERGDLDEDWAIATQLTLSSPRAGLRLFAGRASGSFRVSIPHGLRVEAPEGVDPGVTGGATISPSVPIITPIQRIGMFRVTPAGGDAGTTLSVSAVGETLDANAILSAPVSAALAARDEAVKLYTVSGPKQSALNTESIKFLITLGPGTVTGTIRVTPGTSAGTGTWNPAYVDLDETSRSKWTKFTPTSEGARDVTFTNDGGLTNPAAMAFQTAARTPGTAVTTYSISGPSSGEVNADSAPFTVAWGAGEVPHSEDDPGTFRFMPYVSPEFEGLGEFFPRYFDLTDSTRSATFVYRPYSAGARSIGFFDIPDVTDASWVGYEALPGEEEPDPEPVAVYTLVGPSSGLVGAQSGLFTITLGSGVVTGTIRFTPTRAGIAGTFSPTFVDLTDSTRSGTFRFTPSAAGAVTITSPDNAGLSDPAGVIFDAQPDVEPDPPATYYTLSGPTQGEVSMSAGYFNVALGPGTVTGTIRVTPQASAGTGFFVPTYVDLSAAIRSGIFQFIPTSAGVRQISVSDNGGLADPGSIQYEAIPSTAPPSAPPDDTPQPATMVPVPMTSSGGRPSWMIKV